MITRSELKQHFSKEEIDVGYHPDGFRIDKTGSPMERYTKWDIDASGRWIRFVPVCFHQLPSCGWIKVKEFNLEI